MGLGDRSPDAEDPNATGEGADSEAKAQQSHHETGRRLALFGFADLEEPISIINSVLIDSVSHLLVVRFGLTILNSPIRISQNSNQPNPVFEQMGHPVLQPITLNWDIFIRLHENMAHEHSYSASSLILDVFLYGVLFGVLEEI